ncbi:DUF397 domain-containing protein [Streptomyces mexicanus]|uniref:DUF397 domain-containing protein n=1 Tax=Streptomyces mexicanus TaxID=178566 RepID=A0A7X1LNQ8_9ACTN|nr:DUF397 domain-containing protein [Streptomyces mexicanus]MBC2863662.1 DUF397 domain-containing protein [Streptomyces mexicanus]
MAIHAEWKKSSYSGGGEGNDCVEIARVHPHIAIRDSKAPSRAALTFPAGAFVTFVEALKTADVRSAGTR